MRGKTAQESKEKLDKYYGANASSDSSVKFWFREFRGGRNSTTDQGRSAVNSPESQGARSIRRYND